MKVLNYTELIVWQKSMDLVENIYLITMKFPKEEIYSLTNQIRRAAVSIPSNIAEGQQRNTTAQFKYFLSVAQGSRAEVETQIRIAMRLSYVYGSEMDKILDLCAEIGKMIHGLENAL
ncbi:four helix bundle protein [Clostridium algidicarnis]|uniref:four helix bundle protein n=1 Tax=Clostridium algidicarnis TaxID=37659 RepID=UPI001624DF19|nr:four helix bundle protein [Clostridium algidicarnis]MBB6698546.1 four helix bundle protein [Clostridium algidicarnis]MBU3210063.1 four helix bundle protein [Clostridium algidicarnis]